MVRRLMKGGHACVVTDLSADAVAALAREGATGAAVARSDWSRRCAAPRVGVGDGAGRRGHRADGGDTRRRCCRRGRHRSSTAATRGSKTTCAAAQAAGRAQGDPLRRCGHERWRVGRRSRLLPDGRRTGRGRSHASSRSSGRWRRARPASRRRAAARASRAPRTWATCTAVRSGAGHFVKMIHNGIEYGLMQAFAEGFDIMRHAGDETLPRRSALRSSTWPTSPSSGGAAASSRRGCSI